MAIKANFTRADVQKRFDAFLYQVVKQQIKRAQMLGEMCVTHARSIPKDKGFQDRTGNLRSSIGYMVFVDGVAVHTGYDVIDVPVKTIKVVRTAKRKLKDGTVKVYTYNANVKVGGNGADGARKGEALARKVGEVQKGVCLVVTAGMNYAIYLEAEKRDVLTSAEQLAERELPKMLQDLIANTKKV